MTGMPCFKTVKKLHVYAQRIYVFHVVDIMNIIKAILALTKKIFQHPKKRNETKIQYKVVKNKFPIYKESKRRKCSIKNA